MEDDKIPNIDERDKPNEREERSRAVELQEKFHLSN